MMIIVEHVSCHTDVLHPTLLLHKGQHLQDAASVVRMYDLDDLGEEWQAVLHEIDDRLFQVLLSMLQGRAAGCSCHAGSQHLIKLLQTECLPVRMVQGLS